MQSLTIFQHYAAQYWERGFQPIPVFGKRVFTKGWSEFSKRRMTEEERLQLEGRDWEGGGAMPGAGIGLVLGFGCFAIDIDSDHKGLLDLLPITPMMKRGKTGATGIYRCAGGISPVNKKHLISPFEILSVGSQTVVPPSLHPVTHESYKWMGDSELVDISELPEVDGDAFWNILETYCKKHMVTRVVKDQLVGAAKEEDTVGVWSTGRNNHLTAWTYGRVVHMEIKQKSVEDIVTDLIAEDKRAHGEKAWLSDESEHKDQGRRSVRERAREMVERAIASAKKKGDYIDTSTLVIDLESDRMAQLPSEQVMVSDDDLDGYSSVSRQLVNRLSDAEVQKLLDQVPYLKMWSRYLMSEAHSYSPALTMGGGLALLSAMAGNLYSSNGARSNLFIMNVAPTGEGKNAPQVAIKKMLHLLRSDGGIQVSSTESYKSTAVICKGFALNHRRVKLDVQDEVGRFFDGVNQVHGPLAGAIPMLCQLFSASSSLIGAQEATDEKRRVDAVANPCLVLFGSTTPKGIKSAMSGQAAAGGLCARTIFMVQEGRESVSELRINHKSGPIPNALFEFTRKYMAQQTKAPEFYANTNLGPCEMPIEVDELEFTPEFESSIKEIHKLAITEAKKNSADGSDLLTTTLTRRTEMIFKLSLLWYVGHDKARRPDAECVGWANAILSHSLFMALGGAKDNYDTLANQVRRTLIEKLDSRVMRVDKLREHVGRALKRMADREPSSQEIGTIVQQIIVDNSQETGRDARGRKIIKIEK